MHLRKRNLSFLHVTLSHTKITYPWVDARFLYSMIEKEFFYKSPLSKPCGLFCVNCSWFLERDIAVEFYFFGCFEYKKQTHTKNIQSTWIGYCKVPCNSSCSKSLLNQPAVFPFTFCPFLCLFPLLPLSELLCFISYPKNSSEVQPFILNLHLPVHMVTGWPPSQTRLQQRDRTDLCSHPQTPSPELYSDIHRGN